jgi:hypothetical protein
MQPETASVKSMFYSRVKYLICFRKKYIVSHAINSLGMNEHMRGSIIVAELLMKLMIMESGVC